MIEAQTAVIEQRGLHQLPGKIRNLIYSFLLISDQPIICDYALKDSDQLMRGEKAPSDSLIAGAIASRRFPIGARKLTDAVTNLTLLSQCDSTMRQEVRTYFYTHNKFAPQGTVLCALRGFRDSIGPDACHSIASLGLRSGQVDVEFELGLRKLRAMAIYSGHLNVQEMSIRLDYRAVIDGQTA